MLFSFPHDFVLEFSGLFFRFIYKATGFFLVGRGNREKRCSGGRKRLIDGVKKGYCFFVIIIVHSVDVANIEQLLVELVLAVF